MDGCQDYEGKAVWELAERWPELRFVHFSMNGADDVVKYGKYMWCGPRYRLITMGRPGFTEEVRRGMTEAKIDADSGFCILGPELPDISSTAVRQAIIAGKVEALEALLDPKVAQWCVTNKAFDPNPAKRPRPSSELAG